MHVTKLIRRYAPPAHGVNDSVAPPALCLYGRDNNVQTTYRQHRIASRYGGADLRAAPIETTPYRQHRIASRREGADLRATPTETTPYREHGNAPTKTILRGSEIGASMAQRGTTYRTVTFAFFCMLRKNTVLSFVGALGNRRLLYNSSAR